MGVETAIGYVKIDGVDQFIRTFVFPGMWFTASMVIMYPLYYFFVRRIYGKYGIKSLKFAIYILSLSYVLMYILKPKWCLFSLEFLNIADEFSIETPYIITHTAWATCMLIGLYIRKHWDFKKPIKVSNHAILVGGCIALFFIIRIIEKTLNIYSLELFLPVTYITFSYSMFAICTALETMVNKYMGSKFGNIITQISRSSIEIYYLQFIFIDKFRNMIFPVNWIVIVLSIIVSAMVFHNNIVSYIFNHLIRKRV